MQVQVSKKHKMLGISDTPQVRNLFPQARPLPATQLLAVPHDLTTTWSLRKLGYQAPSPILTHYEFPGSVKPFDVQRQTCALLTMNPRAYCLNGLGTGKTKSALWSWDYLNANGYAKKLLVVAPLSTLRFVWAREIFATLPHRTVAVLHGSKAKRLENLGSDADIYVINHDGVKSISAALVQAVTSGVIDSLVLDELAVYRNMNARTKQAIELAKTMQWVWGMSGSPMPNEPTDVFGQAKIVTPGSVPKYFGRFREALCTAQPMGGFTKWIPKPNAIDQAFAVMQPAVRFSLDDVVELPECIERTVDVELSNEQKRVYKAMAEKCYAAVKTKEITAVNAGAAMSKLLQVSSGWVYTADGRTVELDNDNRISALIDAILGAERKVLVFVPFKHTLKGISDALTKEKIEHACMSGDTPEGERSQIFNLFQNTSKYRVLVAHPRCLAHGVNLTAADTVIWFAPISSFETYDQANARIRRVGQRHKQLILHLQATPVERKLYRLLAKKEKTQINFLELFETATETTDLT